MHGIDSHEGKRKLEGVSVILDGPSFPLAPCDAPSGRFFRRRISVSGQGCLLENKGDVIGSTRMDRSNWSKVMWKREGRNGY